MEPITPFRKQQSRDQRVRLAQVSDGPEILENAIGSNLIEMAQGMEQLDHNLEHLKQIHNQMVSFNESFSALLHSLRMSAWCTEFEEAPLASAFSVERDPFDSDRELEDEDKFYAVVDGNDISDEKSNEDIDQGDHVGDMTYMTDSASFIAEPTNSTALLSSVILPQAPQRQLPQGQSRLPRAAPSVRRQVPPPGVWR
jgi:DASH complex subunit DAM1